MDFELTVVIFYADGKEEERTTLHYTPDTLWAQMTEETSKWNVLYPEAHLCFNLRKVPNDTPTLGVGVSDDLLLGERLN